MSSSQTSSSSSEAPAVAHPFARVRDVSCPVNVLLGTGTMSVRECLALTRNSIVELTQSAGEDLQLVVNGVLLARGEIVIIEDSAALRITEICAPAAASE